jgi:hypothetical protein
MRPPDEAPTPEDLMRDMKARGLLPGFFECWSLRDCITVPVHGLFIVLSSAFILRLIEDRVLTAVAIRPVLLVAYGGILLSLAHSLWSDWRARQLRFVMALDERGRSRRTMKRRELSRPGG